MKQPIIKNPIQVVMLPTEDRTDIVEVTMGNLKELRHVPTLLLENLDVNDYRLKSYQHVYITVAQDVEPIKEGECCYHIPSNEIVKCPSGGYPDGHARKIISSTDPKLKLYEAETLASASGFSLKTDDVLLPQVQQSFLKEYIANPNGEWEVEYKDWCDYDDDDPSGLDRPDLRLVVNQDNTVNITAVEEKMIPMDKVLKLVEESNHFSYLQGVKIGKGEEANGVFSIQDWIKENL